MCSSILSMQGKVVAILDGIKFAVVDYGAAGAIPLPDEEEGGGDGEWALKIHPALRAVSLQLCQLAVSSPFH